ncbi:MAG: hypothetical protein PHR35_10830 [Kiritimatiellae bacterium]|nr:hypothetical protein [Kiritimatiellia bacterium]
MKIGYWLAIGFLGILASVPKADAVGVGARAGTTGFGGEAAFELVPDYLNLRVAGNYGWLDLEVHEDDLDYDSDIDLQTWMLLLDWHVGGGPFKLVAGGCYNGSEVSGEASPNEPVEIGNTTYTPAQIGHLFASADYDTFGGYAGIGFGNLASGRGRWTASLDLGVMMFGEPDLTLESRGGLLSNTPQVKREVKRELDDFEDDYIEWLRFYPVLSIGLAVRF